MKATKEEYDVIVIGGGPAGSTSSMYTSRANLSTLVIDKGITSGALGATSKISNFPGVPDVKGIDLLKNIQEQAKSFGAEFISDKVIGVDLNNEIKTIYTNDGIYKARSVILASGSMGRSNTIEGEKRFIGRGVSYCATCDGAFYKDAVVAVIGNNDEALEELLFLTKYAKKVYLINKFKELKARKELIEKVENNPKVEILNETRPLKIQGNLKLESILISSKENVKKELEVSGVFIYLQGNKPIIDYTMGQISVDDKGCVNVNSNMETSIEGVFAIGDLLCTHPKQAAIAAGDGAIAAIAVDKWLNKKATAVQDWRK
ncbi:MAG: FAD-dependent oxidoreductase [Bacteroidales bacterium]|nr:FAD-dependent oxidoreductase [Bacteroidales bacterium]